MNPKKSHPTRRLCRIVKGISIAAVFVLAFVAIGVQGSLECGRIAIGQAMAWQGGIIAAAVVAMIVGNAAEVLE